MTDDTSVEREDDNRSSEGHSMGGGKSGNHRIFRRIVGLLLTGLAAVVPVVGTAWLLVLIYQVLLKVGGVMIKGVLKGLSLIRSGEEMSPEDVTFYGSDFVYFLIPLILLLLIGFTVASRPGSKVLQWMDRVMEQIPYLGFIYSAIKQFVDALRSLGGRRKFKSVAYVEYPSPGCRMLGFVTGTYHDPQIDKNVTTVFLPTSPNPMTGFVIIIEDEKVYNSEMSLEEASKMILSAGLVAPASYLNKE